MLTHPLLPKLRELKLSGILATLPQRTQLAQEQSLSPTEFLALLLDDEIERRLQYRLSRRTREAGLDPSKTLARFDFSAAPQVSKSLIADLALCHFVERGENLILAGQTCTGKTHLGTALGFSACSQGKKVRFFTVTSLVTQLLECREEHTLKRFHKQLERLDLVILDELGYVPFSMAGAELLFEVVSRAYERTSLIVTTNLPFES